MLSLVLWRTHTIYIIVTNIVRYLHTICMTSYPRVILLENSTCTVSLGSVADLDPHPEDPMFLGLPDRHPDPLVTTTDPAPEPAKDPSIIKQNNCKKKP